MSISYEQQVALQPGDRLWGKYLETLYTATIIELPDTKDGMGCKIDGDDRQFISPRRAGAAIMTEASGRPQRCNGWLFWTVGEYEEGAKPGVRTLPESQKRHRKPKETATTTPMEIEATDTLDAVAADADGFEPEAVETVDADGLEPETVEDDEEVVELTDETAPEPLAAATGRKRR